MSKITVLGEPRGLRSTIFPNKRCLECPMLDDSLNWCKWYKKRIEDWKLEESCKVHSIIVEEV